MPLALIDKKDNFEIVRDELAAILALETANQQALATAVGKDPDLWKFRVFAERSGVWESLQSQIDGIPVFPVVNIWFSSLDFATDQAGYTLTQVADPGSYNIDIFASALTEKLSGPGQKPGDLQAALDCQRIVRLVRNILFSVPADTTKPGDNYPYLNLPGVVMERKIQSIQYFIPDYKEQGVHIQAARIPLAVKFSEFALEGPDNPFELVQLQTVFNETGEVLYEFDLKV